MYTRGASTDEFLAYSRVIRLEHSGTANGALLGSFEHADFSGGAASLLIRRSTDDGTTWSTLATLGDPLTGTALASADFPTSLAAGVWYHLSVEVVGCRLVVTGVPAKGGAKTSIDYTDTGCILTNGAIGVRVFKTAAAWRNLTVSPR